jgi:hypothetical protein
MATSTNYGWAEPDNTDLVTNGALAIRTLGNAIDTSLWNSGYGQAGKNKIINGDYTINQRSFTSNTTSGDFNFDRWKQINSGGTFTLTPQTFTPGVAPVAGYEGKTFLQGITSGQSAAGDYAIFQQPIENVRTFAGQSVTISFWAKASTGTPKIAVELGQSFGSGGSSAVFTSGGAVTTSTSWARYSVTMAVPSISGKTVSAANDTFIELLLWVSAGSTYASRASSIGIQNNTFQIWGVQVEYGSKATPFQTASGGSIQGELAMCQRYYYRKTANQYLASGYCNSTTNADFVILHPTTMRVAPTMASNSGTNYFAFQIGTGLATANSIGNFYDISTFAALARITTSGLVLGQGGVASNNNASAYLEGSAEL